MPSNKNRPETGGLQQKKEQVIKTPAEIKAEKKAEKAKRKEKVKAVKKERVGLFRRLRETGGELRKVRWPTLGQTLKQTGVVLTVVVLFAIVVFGIDQGLGALYRLLTKGL